MKRFDGILICTDLDGTLLRGDKSISNENLQAIEYFKAEGGIFTFITGRMPYFVSDIYNTVSPNAPFGCINGGGLYDHRTGKYVWKQTLPRTALELVEYADRELPGIGIQVNTFEKIYFATENSAMAYFRRVTGLPNITRHYYDVEEPLAKIVFGDEDVAKIEALDTLLHAHPNAEHFDFIRSERILYEILPKGIHKGVALQKLAEHLGISPEKTVAVGDYNNDIGMLRFAKCGVAVANATAATKAAADYITVSNEEHAIAKVIEDIACGKISI
jgi:Cof subfamily protein (haloacid dehalogenase superfamily)